MENNNRVLYADIDDVYFNEFKKLCIEKGISMKAMIERFIYLEVDKYIEKNLLYKEPEGETDENIPREPKV